MSFFIKSHDGLSHTGDIFTHKCAVAQCASNGLPAGSVLSNHMYTFGGDWTRQTYTIKVTTLGCRIRIDPNTASGADIVGVQFYKTDAGCLPANSATDTFTCGCAPDHRCNPSCDTTHTCDPIPNACGSSVVSPAALRGLAPGNAQGEAGSAPIMMAAAAALLVCAAAVGVAMRRRRSTRTTALGASHDDTPYTLQVNGTLLNSPNSAEVAGSTAAKPTLAEVDV